MRGSCEEGRRGFKGEGEAEPALEVFHHRCLERAAADVALEVLTRPRAALCELGPRETALSPSALNGFGEVVDFGELAANDLPHASEDRTAVVGWQPATPSLALALLVAAVLASATVRRPASA